MLRGALAERFPWTTDTRFGPSAVEAGECDGCGAEARVVQICGPGSEHYLGRRCLLSRGETAFCDGHERDAADAASWVRTLPAEADMVAHLWWVATGEVSLRQKDLAAAANALDLPASDGAASPW